MKEKTEDVTFTEKDTEWVCHPHHGALVIKVSIGAVNVQQVFTDNGSSVNVLCYDIYKKLDLLYMDMELVDNFVYEFGGEAVKVKRTVSL